jgi:predicted dehydrogenase
MGKIKVGIVGCGNISSIYMKNLSQVFEITEIAACADLIPERSQKQVEQFGIPAACSVEELLSDDSIRIVLNLTIPAVHAQVSLEALKAGKNVYSEKPLAITMEDGIEIQNLAKEKGLLTGCAPDTFMGGGLQTCRKLIDDGWIGKPVAATAFMLCHGHESWHPDPEFYYQTGGGPMFDMGPYYLTALVSLLGPVSRIAGSTAVTYPQRTITSAGKYGKKIDVEVPTHIAGVMDFKQGAIATIITSFDVWHSQLPRIEVYGSEGTLSVPDPNTFGGPVLIRRHDQSDWREIPLTHGYSENSRGIGVADMAYSLVSGRKHRANGDMAYHVLELMHGIHDSSCDGKYYTLTSTCERPEALPMGLLSGTLDQ